MTPPEAPQSGSNACAGEHPPAVSLRLVVLQKRSDFLRTSRGKRAVMPGFILQMARTPDAATADRPEVARIGFTCSKKVGNAVARNRAKRRLREIARLVMPDHAIAGHDYVLVGRRDATADLSFETLKSDLRQALDRVHGASA